jgi:hypothetical protein
MNEDNEEAIDLALDPLFGTLEVAIWRISPDWGYTYLPNRPRHVFNSAPIHETNKKLGGHRIG